MIGELLQLSRENEELRKEIDALKADLAQEREKSEGLRGALEEIIEMPCCPNSKYPGCKVCGAIDILVHRDKYQALLAAKRDGGNG